MFLLLCDMQLATGRDAVQVSGLPNKAQLKNVGIANSLYAFSTLVTQVRGEGVCECECV